MGNSDVLMHSCCLDRSSINKDGRIDQKEFHRMINVIAKRTDEAARKESEAEIAREIEQEMNELKRAQLRLQLAHKQLQAARDDTAKAKAETSQTVEKLERLTGVNRTLRTEIKVCTARHLAHRLVLRSEPSTPPRALFQTTLTESGAAARRSVECQEER